METVTGYVRICPTCRAENAPDVLRCACGAMLAGIDVVRRNAEPTEPATVVPAEAESDGGTGNDSGSRLSPGRPGAIVCPHPDCRQTNPAGSVTCAYCNRPLAGAEALTPTGLLKLPAVLAARFRIVRTLPARGAEAELLVVQPHQGGPERIAKIYRPGIEPRRAVQSRIDRVDLRHRVQILESGLADGHAFELMEYCVHGSLRDLMQAGAFTAARLTVMVGELAAAIASVHAAGLVHRDLKPENVLVRSLEPLELVLTDFSIASVLDGTQRFTGVARTLSYAPPESLSGIIDGKSDYWALGMIALEATQGAHPFAGLSDAVILHQLTTRNVDTVAVPDRNVRKLVRGLLLRDPARRWGAAEVTRWLSGDATLEEPAEQGTVAGFGEPYRLGEVVCTTPDQLAVALATHWREGVADLGNSQLIQWFRTVQKDQNVVRLLIEVRQERQLHVDMQLLKLILHLAPGIPPVWRGESIALPAILAHASQALEGDPDAAQWLHALYVQRVLEAYAEAGNLAMKQILERWNVAGDAFEKSWKEALSLIRARAPKAGPDEAVNWDTAMYGRLDPSAPSIVGLHARLLAIAYDASWAERLRKRLLAETATLAVHCAWLSELGDPRTMSATGLLVLEALLPEATKTVDRQVKADLRRRSEAAEDCRRKSADLDTIIGELRALGARRFPTGELCSELLSALQRYFDLATAIRSSGRSDEAWLQLRNAAIRLDPMARRMQRLVERLRERLAVTTGWLNLRTALPLLLLLLALPRLGARFIVPMIVIVPIAIAAWQLLPNYMLLAQIRALAERL